MYVDGFTVLHGFEVLSTTEDTLFNSRNVSRLVQNNALISLLLNGARQSIVLSIGLGLFGLGSGRARAWTLKNIWALIGLVAIVKSHAEDLRTRRSFFSFFCSSNQ